MGVLMDLVAGDAREILLALGTEDWAGLADPTRFDAYLSLGGGMDTTWLDLFSEAAREVVGGSEPGPFSKACLPLATDATRRLAAASDRAVDRVDPRWIEAVAAVPQSLLGRLAARWIELVEKHVTTIDSDEKPMLRALAEELVSFCRQGRNADDVLFAWTF